MDTKAALAALDALAHPSRLDAFRELVQAGTDGLPAGEIARRLGVIQNTMSSHLQKLAHAGLVAAARDGRSIRYCADYAAVRALVLYLLEDCCRGRREICAPVVGALTC